MRTGLFSKFAVTAALVCASVFSTSCSMQFFRNKAVNSGAITQTNTKHTVTVGTTYAITLSGGLKPYSYKIVSGSGTISNTGVYSAPATVVNPGADGSEPIVIMITDAKQKSTTVTIYLVDVLALNSNNVDIVPTGTFAFSATGGKQPYTYSVISGLGSVDSAGLYTSTAAQGVSFVQVTDADGNTDQAMVNVFLPLNPAMVNINIPVNTTYTIAPTTGTPNFGFAVTLGSGSLSTPSAASSVYTAPAIPGAAQVTVTDQLAATKVYAFNIYGPLTYVPNYKDVQVTNSFPFGVTGGVPPYSHAVISGGASGSIVAGTGNFTATGVPGTVVIQVTDSIANTTTATVNVYSPLTIAPTPFSMMVLTGQTFSGGGGVPPYSYSVFAGGGAINAVSGAYTAGAAPGAVTIRVTDSVANTADATVTVTGPLTIPPLVALAPTNTYNIAPTGGQPPFFFAVTAGAAGGSLSTPGPAANSTYTAALPTGTNTITVTDSSVPTPQTATMSIQVNAALGMTCTQTTITTANTSTCTATNGVPGYTYSVVGGAPNGTVTVGGVYTPPGTPGVYTVRVTDSYGNIVNVPITVNAAISLAPGAAAIAVAQNQVETVSGGVPPFVFSKSSGPADASVVTLTATTAKGQAGMTPGTLVMQVTDALGNSTTASIGIGTPPAINGAPSTRNIHKSQTDTITPSGGAPSVNGTLNYSFAIIAGGGSLSLATGLSTVYTAPGATGSATVRITDGVSAPYDIVYTIIPDLTISPTSYELMVNNTKTFTASNVVGTATFSVVSVGGGSIVGATGSYTAPAAVPGANPATIRVTDSGPQQADSAVTIDAQLAVAPAAVNILTTQTQTLNISGGVQPYTFSFVGFGSIAPTGLQGMGVTSTLFSAGALAGVGTFTVTDALGNIVNVATAVGNVAAPTGFIVTGATPTSINTSWNVVPGATGYKVQVDGGGYVDIGNVLTYNFTGLASGVLHSLDVLAYNGGGPGAPTSITQKICAVDNKLSAGSCVACAVGEYSAGGITAACTACSNGAGNFVYTGLGGGANNCAYACNNGYGSASCTTCGNGVYDSVANGTEACANCSASTYAGAGPNTSCTNCAVGTWSAAAASSCGACTNNTTGFYWTTNGTTAAGCTNTACTNKLGTSTYTGHGGTTNTCAYGCDPGYGTAACTQCAIDTKDGTAGGQEACVACLTGEYAAVGQTTCTACTNKPVNAGSATYSGVGGGLNQCPYTSVNCNASYYWNSVTTFAGALCPACAVGTYSLANSTSCSACTNNTNGFYWTTNGTTAGGCTNTPCTTGVGTFTYTSHGGTTDSCSYACNAGYGTAACTQCPIDTKDGTAGGTEACVACLSGQFAPVGQTTCTNCTNKPANAASATYSGLGGGVNQCPYTAVTCNAAYEWNLNTTYAGALCNACSVGQWSASGGTCAACTNTTAGMYWTTNGTIATGCTNAACTNGLGTFTYLTHGGTSPTGCTYACNAGYGTASCTQCTAGTYDSVGGGQEACATCAAATFSAAGATSCTACAVGTWAAAGSGSCAACTNNTVGNYWTTNGTIATGCTNAACTTKPVNAVYTTHGGTTDSCLFDCNAGYGGASCTGCAIDTKDGTAGGIEACVACSAGQYAAALATTCTNCTNKPANAASATYSGVGGGVNQCPYTAVTCNAAFEWNGTTTYAGAACNACATGQWSASGGSCAACTNNTTGFYWNSNATTAAGCGLTACSNKLGTSTYTGHGGTTNTCAYSCNAGYGTASCTQCAIDTKDGTAGGQEACVACNIGEYAAAGSTSCTACTNMPANATSVTYSTTGGGVNQCNYTSVTCSGGYAWNSNGTFAGAQCNLSACPSGTGWDGSACTTCAAGTYDATPGAGLDACTPCAAGTYQASTGQTSCTSAGAGFYASGTGNTGQTACAVGTYSTGGASSCSACTNTTAGFYWTSNGTTAGGCTNTACTNTPANGKYWSTHGGTSATGCTNTASCTNGVGTFTYTSNGGNSSTGCSYSCNAGYGSASCTQCSAGTYDSVGGGQEACASASAGYYVGSAGQTSQTACAVGTYSTGGASSCASCTNNTAGNYWTTNGTSAGGCTNTACTNKLGTSTYTGHGGTTNSCAYSCNAGYGSASCTQCGTDKYDSVGGGQEACANCSAGQYSSPGSTSCSNCTNVPAYGPYTGYSYGTTGGGANQCGFSSVSCAANYAWNSDGSWSGSGCDLTCLPDGTIVSNDTGMLTGGKFYYQCCNYPAMTPAQIGCNEDAYISTCGSSGSVNCMSVSPCTNCLSY